MDDNFSQFLNTICTDDTVVLTANRRLASCLHQEYVEYQKLHNKVVWETPHILPLSTWLHTLWKKMDIPYLVLSNIQEQALWKQISQQNWATISTIQQAWETLQAWNINLEQIEFDENNAVQCFLQWACHFKNECQKNFWISSAEIPKQLFLLTIEKYFLPSTIFLTGFDDLPPIMTQLFKKFSEYCCVETLKRPLPRAITIKRFELEDTESEIYHSASKALEENKKNPLKKIACVIPNLTSLREQVIRIFSDVFSEHPVFNVSAGQQLNAFLLVQTALGTIQGKWKDVLQSPYLTQSDIDRDIAAFVDKQRRADNLLTIEMHDLISLFNTLHSRFPSSSYLKRWNRLLQYKKNIPTSQTLSQWIQTFIEILEIMQWPGTRTLDSTEHQVLQRWLTALEELTYCDGFFSVINFETAFDILNHHISQIIFQPKSDAAPIQVLGLLETAGLQFDTLWLMGLDNESWPPPPTPNPFLPYALQMQHNMPHASAERELYFTQQTMERLCSSASEVFLSSPKTDNDRILAPSQLITNIEIAPTILILNQEHNTSGLIEQIIDDCGTPLIKGEKVKGGSSVLKYQAICPFKAYATFRLKADPLETPTLGLSHKLRGQILHQTLELLWKQIQSKQHLVAIEENELNKIISTVIDKITEMQSLNRSDCIFLKTEKKRLQKIIKDWLSIEKKRDPFTVVAYESAHQITIGPLSFHCRIDRIDQLENGTRWIIDYKSGYCTLHDWFTQRPSDPQLPMYCVFSNEQTYDGIAFAQVRAGAMQFKGIVNETTSNLQDSNIVSIDEIDNPDGINDWDSLTTHWKTTLENLSTAFYQGKAEVDPLESACTYCELQPLCRVNLCQT